MLPDGAHHVPAGITPTLDSLVRSIPDRARVLDRCCGGGWLRRGRWTRSHRQRRGARQPCCEVLQDSAYRLHLRRIVGLDAAVLAAAVPVPGAATLVLSAGRSPAHIHDPHLNKTDLWTSDGRAGSTDSNP